MAKVARAACVANGCASLWPCTWRIVGWWCSQNSTSWSPPSTCTSYCLYLHSSSRRRSCLRTRTSSLPAYPKHPAYPAPSPCTVDLPSKSRMRRPAALMAEPRAAAARAGALGLPEAPADCKIGQGLARTPSHPRCTDERPSRRHSNEPRTRPMVRSWCSSPRILRPEFFLPDPYRCRTQCSSRSHHIQPQTTRMGACPGLLVYADLSYTSSSSRPARKFHGTRAAAADGGC